MIKKIEETKLLKRFVGLVVIFILASSLNVYPQTKEKIADKKFWMVNGSLIGSTIYDLETTFYTLKRCHEGCEEGNPLMKPFIKSGRPASYAVSMGIDSLIIYGSYSAKKIEQGSGKRHWWWLLPTIATATHAIAGSHNLKIAFEF